MRSPPSEAEHDEPEQQLSPDDMAARLLFSRARGATNVQRLARAADLPFARCEELLCRGLSTLAAGGYAPKQLCQELTLTPEQLARAAAAPPFGPEFDPAGLDLAPAVPAPSSVSVETRAEVRKWHLATLKQGNGAAHGAEPETDEARLVAELRALLQQDRPEEPRGEHGTRWELRKAAVP